MDGKDIRRVMKKINKYSNKLCSGFIILNNHKLISTLTLLSMDGVDITRVMKMISELMEHFPVLDLE